MSLRKKKNRYPDDPPEASCPHCGEKGEPCSFVNSLARGWARQACSYKHNKNARTV